MPLHVQYKTYVATLTQSGTNAPVASVLENTLGGTVVWTRDSQGHYTATLAGAFTENKTFCPPTSGGVSLVGLFGSIPNDSSYTAGWDSVNTVTLRVFDNTGNNIDLNTSVGPNPIFIEIRVYP